MSEEAKTKRTIIICMTVVILGVLAVVGVGVMLDKISATIAQAIIGPIVVAAAGAAVWKAHRAEPPK